MGTIARKAVIGAAVFLNHAHFDVSLDTGAVCCWRYVSVHTLVAAGAGTLCDTVQTVVRATFAGVGDVVQVDARTTSASSIVVDHGRVRTGAGVGSGVPD